MRVLETTRSMLIRLPLRDLALKMRPSLALFALLALTTAPLAAMATTTVAVVSISSKGIDPWWGIQFEPGKALQDLLTNDLVDTNKLTVVERENIQSVFDEQKLDTNADVSASDAVQLGHTLGARYLIVGRIVHLDKVGKNSGLIGSVFSRMPLNIGGAGVSATKVHLGVALRVIDASTGQIVKAYTFDQSKSGTSLLIGDISDNVGGYSSQQFKSSVIGQLITEAANQLATQIADANFAAGPAGPSLTGTIIAIVGSNVILNLGSADGITQGMFLNAFQRVTATDPTTHRSLTTDVPNGQIQVISVDAHSSVARELAGQSKVGDIAKTP